jgi:pantoate--beta-alanine ligase
LEDGDRPHFFGGVCLVVARLFDVLRPSAAVFGEKDWQQLKTIEAMVASTPRFNSLEILAGGIVREPDGLAMSSRNRALQPEDRHAALGLIEALQAASGEPDPATAEASMLQILSERGLSVDYAVVRDASTLLAPKDGAPTRALIAARLKGQSGSLRLIDNALGAPFSTL